jgi:hypothetical protein
MHELTDDERKQILGEVLMDELKAIREGISDLPTRSELKELKTDVSDLKSDMKVVKLAVKDISRQSQKQDHRLSLIEDAT